MTIVMLAIVAAVGTPVIIPMTIMAFGTSVTTGAVVSTTAVTAAATTANRKDLPDPHAPLPLLFLSQNGLFLGRCAHREKRQGDRRHPPATRCPAVIYGTPKRATTERKTGTTSWPSFEPPRQMVRPETQNRDSAPPAGTRTSPPPLNYALPVLATRLKSLPNGSRTTDLALSAGITRPRYRW